jgi:hypothetical protein
MDLTPKDIARFWSKVAVIDDEDSCWLWQASTNGGYGAFGLHYRTVRANRVSYVIAYGPIPDDIFVLHTCDNRRCVRPRHLFLGDHTDNATDAMMKDRLSKPRGPRKLSDDQIREIIRRRSSGELLRMIAVDFGVGPEYVSKIFRGDIIRTIPEEVLLSNSQ